MCPDDHPSGGFPSRTARRDFLRLSAAGVAAPLLSGLVNSSAGATQVPAHVRHHPARATSVIFLYMSGGVSQVDSFDPKPLLKTMHGKPLPGKIERTQFDKVGTILDTFWKAGRHGESGLEMTDLFPQIAARADRLAVVRSVTAKFSEHAQGNFFVHTGFPFLGHPSAGAWVAHGLGTANSTLPPYVVLRSKEAEIPHGGVSIFGNGYLPASCGASIFDLSDRQAVPNLTPRLAREQQRRALDIIARLDRGFANRVAIDRAILDAVANAETAFEMQQAVPAATDLAEESPATLAAYGVDSPNPHLAQYARQCLMARRLVERRVRFVELSCGTFQIGGGGGGNPWDQHGKIKKGHGAMAEQVDQPIAALLDDLAERGLLESTLVVFTGEFGRTPFAQGDGRDHNPFGFSLWLAGGGVKGGVAYGATDEFGYHAVENVSTVYDLWATVLHCLGIDHERLTFRHGGRDMRLTDVQGNVWRDILA
ncbi:MAG: DUF1501 domain-containing protein [Planctomycetota bacterium]